MTAEIIRIEDGRRRVRARRGAPVPALPATSPADAAFIAWLQFGLAVAEWAFFPWRRR